MLDCSVGLRARLGVGPAEPTESCKVLLEELLGGRRSPCSGDGAAPEITVLLPSFCYHLSISLDTGVFSML